MLCVRVRPLVPASAKQIEWIHNELARARARVHTEAHLLALR